jgi:elongation factor Ts
MGVTAAAVKELRERTGAGMMDCKGALVETDGNVDEAIKVLRTKGLSAAAKKAHRTASDGMVAVVGDARRMVALELNCETEPVASNKDFRAFATGLAEQALRSSTKDVEALKTQAYTGDPEHTVEQCISLKVALIGENIVLSNLALVEAAAGNKLASYVHGGGRIGVIVEGTGATSDEALHDVALHVAASDPRYARREEVTEAVLANEREIALKQVMEQGKPEAIAQKIVAGKMEKYFEQSVLSEQPFAKDSSMSVGEYLTKACGQGAAVLRFVRFKLGEA